jgi:hypothetical protein
MEKKGLNVNKIRSKIDDLIVKTVFALLPEMRVECAFDDVKANYFQVKYIYFSPKKRKLNDEIYKNDMSICLIKLKTK